MVPERWQEVIQLLLAPIAWVPRMQEALLAFFLAPSEAWLTAVKYALLAFPALLGVGAVWVTLLSLYTLPFRSGRVRFVSMMLLAWWTPPARCGSTGSASSAWPPSSRAGW
jgi:hypothetical protein